MKALSFNNVTFRYADERPILDDASFSIEEGEFVALVGRNGSGKSTIARLACAFAAPDEGELVFFNESVNEIIKRGGDELLEYRCNIGLVMQNPDDQFVASRVIDEVAFGPSGAGIDKNEVLDRTWDALRRADVGDLAERDVNSLSGGQKQRVALADALAMEPRLFIFDEPTSMLDEEGRSAFMKLVKALHAGRASIIMITHSSKEAAFADRIIKIEDGKIEDAPDFFNEEEAHFQAVRDLKDVLAKERSANDSERDKIIEFDDVSFIYDDRTSAINEVMGISSCPQQVFDGLSLDFFDEDLVCVTGPNGSGKSTMAAMMNGLLKPTEGEVRVFDVATSSRHGANSARKHVGLCAQYPERAFFCQSVLEEVSYGPRNLGHGKTQAEKMAIEALSSVGILDEGTRSANPFTLSGGTQRKVALASILSMKPDVLVLDEPCAGLDIDGHCELLSLLLTLHAKGQCVVMITHDERDINILADRVLNLS